MSGTQQTQTPNELDILENENDEYEIMDMNSKYSHRCSVHLPDLLNGTINSFDVPETKNITNTCGHIDLQECIGSVKFEISSKNWARHAQIELTLKTVKTSVEDITISAQHCSDFVDEIDDLNDVDIEETTQKDKIRKINTFRVVTFSVSKLSNSILTIDLGCVCDWTIRSLNESNFDLSINYIPNYKEIIKSIKNKEIKALSKYRFSNIVHKISVDTLNYDIKYYQNELIEKKLKLSGLRTVKTNLEKKNQEITDDLNDILLSNTKLQTKYKSVCFENKFNKNELTIHKNKYNRMCKTTKELQEEIDSLKETVDSMKLEIADKNSQLCDANSTLNKKVIECGNFKDCIKELFFRLKEKDAIILNKDDTILEYKEEIKYYKQKLDENKFQEENKQLKEENCKLTHDIKNVNKQLQIAHNDYEELDDECNEIETSLMNANIKIKTLNNTIRKLELEHKTKNTNNKHTENKINELTNEILNLNAQIIENNSTIHTLTKDNKSYCETLNSQKNLIEKISTDMDTYKTSNKNMKSILDIKEKDIINLEDLIIEYKSELNKPIKSRDEYKNLVRDKDYIQKQNENIKRKFNELKKSYDKYVWDSKNRENKLRKKTSVNQKTIIKDLRDFDIRVNDTFSYYYDTFNNNKNNDAIMFLKETRLLLNDVIAYIREKFKK